MKTSLKGGDKKTLKSRERGRATKANREEREVHKQRGGERGDKSH